MSQAAVSAVKETKKGVVEPGSQSGRAAGRPAQRVWSAPAGSAPAADTPPSWGSLHLGTKQAGLQEPWGTPHRPLPSPASALFSAQVLIPLKHLAS